MQLGNFSVSLVVKEIARAREFYGKFGFAVCIGVFRPGTAKVTDPNVTPILPDQHV